jgi:hypothetical protein
MNHINIKALFDYMKKKVNAHKNHAFIASANWEYMMSKPIFVNSWVSAIKSTSYPAARDDTDTYPTH